MVNHNLIGKYYKYFPSLGLVQRKECFLSLGHTTKQHLHYFSKVYEIIAMHTKVKSILRNVRVGYVLYRTLVLIVATATTEFSVIQAQLPIKSEGGRLSGRYHIIGDTKLQYRNLN